jgi:aminoglycoside phosphotransferase (APT) family kinase protein
MTESVDTLRDFLDGRIGDSSAIEVEAMVGGGSCEIFGVQRGKERWVLRRAPVHRNSATAHDVLREFRILDAIKDEAVSIARPILACDDPDVFGAPFYVMERIDGVPVRAEIPSAWTANPQEQSQALDQLVDALVAIHAIDWQQCGLSDLAHSGPYLARQVDRWMSQLDSYHGRPLPSAARIASWLDDHRPADQVPALAHGDYKLDNVLFSPDAPPRLLAVVDWEMASIADPLIDLGWAMIFHPGPEGTIPLGVAASSGFDRSQMPARSLLMARYAERSGRDVGGIDWYHVFARWKLAIVLEGSYAKFLRGESKKAVHEFFGMQTDLLLESATSIAEEH